MIVASLLSVLWLGASLDEVNAGQPFWAPHATATAQPETMRVAALQTESEPVTGATTVSDVVGPSGRPVQIAASERGCGPTWSHQRCCPIHGVDSSCSCMGPEGTWDQMAPLDFETYGPGEYIGPARSHHVDKYRVRVGDQMGFIYRLTREESRHPYEFNVGDLIRIESDTVGTAEQPVVSRELSVLPDGTITLPLIGQVPAAGRTVEELRKDIEAQYKSWYNISSWTVTPIQVETRLEDLRAAVTVRFGQGNRTVSGNGQVVTVLVSPDGTVQLPAVGSVCVQGLNLDEVAYEVQQRYVQARFTGLEITPQLDVRAPTFVYVVGEVPNPGRFTLERPTTAMQAIALAGGWIPGGNLRQIVVFRRADDWRLVATKLDLRGALLGKRPNPADEIFLRDSDIILVPKTPIRRADDLIRLGFTEGINQLLPFGDAIGILTLSRF